MYPRRALCPFLYTGCPKKKTLKGCFYHSKLGKSYWQDFNNFTIPKTWNKVVQSQILEFCKILVLMSPCGLHCYIRFTRLSFSNFWSFFQCHPNNLPSVRIEITGMLIKKLSIGCKKKWELKHFDFSVLHFSFRISKEKDSYRLKIL